MSGGTCQHKPQNIFADKIGQLCTGFFQCSVSHDALKQLQSAWQAYKTAGLNSARDLQIESSPHQSHGHALAMFTKIVQIGVQGSLSMLGRPWQVASNGCWSAGKLTALCKGW